MDEKMHDKKDDKNELLSVHEAEFAEYIIDQTTDKEIVIKVSCSVIEHPIGNVIKKICKKHLEEKIRPINFDLAPVTFCDSSGVGALLYLIQYQKKNNSKIAVSAISAELNHLFNALLLDHFIEIV